METHIAAGEFKAKCLKILDQVHDKHESFIITKRGVPFAKMTPLAPEKKRDPFGWMAGSVIENGDIINTPSEVWDAEEGKWEP